jgi:hypothetical protein
VAEAVSVLAACLAAAVVQRIETRMSARAEHVLGDLGVDPDDPDRGDDR